MAEQRERGYDSLQSFGRRLFEEALPKERTLHSLSVCLKRLYAAVRESLSSALGVTAVRTLMARAVRQAANSHVYLNQVGVYEDDIDAETAIDQKTDRDYDEVRSGFEDIWQSFLRLLAELVGSDLAGTLVRGVKVHSPREGGQEDEG